MTESRYQAMGHQLKIPVKLNAHFGQMMYCCLFRQSLAQTNYLRALVEHATGLELLPSGRNDCVTYRFIYPGLSKGKLNQLNCHILSQLQKDGVVSLSHKEVDGWFAISAATAGGQQDWEDYELLVSESQRIGRELLTGVRRGTCYPRCLCEGA